MGLWCCKPVPARVAAGCPAFHGFVCMSFFTAAGLLFAALACLCIYAASPRQSLWATPWPQRPARLAGAVLLIPSWLALLQDMQRLTACFTLLTTLMLVFALLPYIGALAHAQRNA